MPKETFNDARGAWSFLTGSTDPKDPETETKLDLALELSWGIDNIVHLKSVNRELDEFDTGFGWSVELDRNTINRLIKTLRRARDHAYGQDE